MKKLLIILTTIVTITLFLTACSNGDKVQASIDEYTKLLNEGKYEQMYEYLSQSSKGSISKEEFIKRYTNIYSAMDVKNIKISLEETDDKNARLVSYSMDTKAGRLNFKDIKTNFVKEDKEYKIEWNESLILGPMVKDDKVSVKTTKASRGSILDRDGNKLAYDGEAYAVGIHPSVFETNKEENINKLAEVLDISKEFIENKLSANKNPEHLVPIVNVSIHEEERALTADDIEGITVTKTPSRVYISGEAFGRILGYIEDIKAEDLEKNKDRGYNKDSEIGKAGLEQVYEDKLRAKDGVHIYIKRGNEEITIAKTDPVNGKDIKIAIDSKLQQEIYKQMNYEKGASVAMDPKTGEVIAMVSSPSYDSNTKVTYLTKTISNKWEENDNAQLANRVSNAYSPGSTMKLITAAIGLENEKINPSEKLDIQGKQWQKDSTWGEYYVTRVKDPKKAVDLLDAAKYSDNIYFAQMAIKIGEKDYLEGIKKFGIGQQVPFEYPIAKSQISTNGKLKKETLLGDTGYGQGEVLMTPLDVTMAYSALGNNGNIMVPRLVISENSQPKVYKEAINPKNVDLLNDIFSKVIEDKDGSGNLAKINGVKLAGKTGTAEIKKSKDDKEGSENGWFTAVNIDDPKIAISIMIEDLKGKSTSQYVVPMVKNVVESYITK